ncbi:Serine/threonine-protein kinase TEL1 [Colletotrichum sp. SAR 10_98]|nr:Serine/threonine-protein kinase TEL1 [Colletotrichum sp. SAR 10_98]
MAPPKLKTGEITVNDALNAVSGGTLKERGAGLDDLIFLLDKKGKTAALTDLGDKHYHRIFEGLFRCAIAEKQNFYGGKRTTAAAAGSRLSKCAEALRLAVAHGASKLKRKTLIAVIDHITQTLPGPGEDADFVEPLLKDYVRSLAALLGHQPNSEHLAILDADGWLACVDFCIDTVSRYLENADRDSISRASPAPGTASMGFSTGRSTNPSQRVTGQIHRGTVQDLLHCIYLLVIPPNAPLWRRTKDLSKTLVQILHVRHVGLGQTTQLAFASINVLLAATQTDDLSRASSLARDLVPLVSHWWQGRTVSQDEMLNSVRDEMLKTIFLTHLHLECLVFQEDDHVLKDIEDLIDALWQDCTQTDCVDSTVWKHIWQIAARAISLPGQSRDIESTIAKLTSTSLEAATASDDSQQFFEILFKIMRPILPSLETESINAILKDDPPLLKLITKIAEACRDQSSRQSSGQNQDFMDLDDEFDSQESKASIATKPADVPRLNTSLSLDLGAFYLATEQRMYFFEAMHNDSGQVGLVPQDFLEQLLDLSDEGFLMCAALTSEIFGSDLNIGPDVAEQVVEKIGYIIGEAEYNCCEVAHSTTLRILEGLMQIWVDEKLEVSKMVGDLYDHLVGSMSKNSLSPNSQVALASLLLALLRNETQRSTYHIFETPGKIAQSAKYAKRCLDNVSTALQLTSSKELFQIFSPQLLYTWLELDAMDDIPFEIFGFASLNALLQEAQAETAALEIMRGRYDSVRTLSERLGMPLAEMVKQSFTKIMAYTIAHETSISASETQNDGSENWVKKLLGREQFLDQIYLNFVDIVALLFDIFDQEDPIEKQLSRDKNFQYASINMEEMKTFAMSPTNLPANQQPMFRSKFLLRELFHLCSQTEYELQTLWTPALSASKIRSSGNAEKGTSESILLLEILKDGERDQKLLNEAARDLALGMLCGDFVVPSTGHQDVIENDDEALQNSALVWKSCNALDLSDEYLAWAGRVVGRSFAASGEIQPELLEESELSRYNRLAPGSNNSEQGLLSLLQQLTQSKHTEISGLAESALRTIVSEADAQGDDALLVASQTTLTEPLFVASAWGPYRTPPTDFIASQNIPDSQVFFRDHVESPDWIQELAVHLAQSVPEYIILAALVPILKNVKGFAQDSFPFIVHLALYSQLDKQHVIKRNLSEATKEWLKIQDESARTNQKHLINTVLYLRTQQLPKETSIADRAMWLDVDFTSAAAAASRCGMYKTALLFTEVAASQATRSSRRSSAVRDEDSTDVLLSIFENIDDPDAYYGLPQPSDLSSVLSRLEYEKDGSKLLAFRGAQYDSHIQRGDHASQSDSQSLVRALGTLGLAGLAYSMQQAQENHDADEDSLASTFQTARRLERWNLPAPASVDNCSVTIYKAYQNIQQAADTLSVRSSIYNGFSHTMRNLVNGGLNAAKLRQHLGALAALTELDDVVNVSDFSELEGMLEKFEQRGQWMRRGRYEDVSHMLSCRETTLSLMSQQPKLRNTSLSTAEARQIEIRSKLMSSGIYRFHQATQESLNVSTSLTSLIVPCEDLGLKVDAAVKIEAANSLWDHGEMIHSIRMLQGIDNDSSLKKQTIPVSRSDLLSKIGHQVSVARLEKPHHIQKNYLEPALKELKGKSEGQQAGRVYHQFAMFCDEQLQNQDGLEDLARLQSLRQGKSDEVAQLQSLIASTRDSQLKTRYQSHLNRAKQWLSLDEQELRRVETTRSEFVRLSLENYLLSLIASDEYNNDALRFTALWLERSDEDATNEAVQKHLGKVPTRKFATLMNQLSSRLQNESNPFQKLLTTLVYNICVDHPYHGMYQIWSGSKVKPRKEDHVAQLRIRAAEKLAGLLQSNQAVAAIWQAIDRTSSYYHRLAVDRDNSKFKAGHKIALKEIHSAQSLVNALIKYHIPPPTMQLEVAADKDYSNVPTIASLDPQMSIASGVSAPKIITAIGTDGQKYRQLVKGGNDDLRQDAIMEQVFAAVSSLLKLHRSTRQRNLGIRTYKVLPLTSASGLIEFVPNTIPLHEFLMPAHERYFPKDLKGSQCRKEISNAQGKSTDMRINTYRKVTERFHPVMKYFFMENFEDPDEWFVRRLAYTRTTAAISMLGHVLGLGDRHGHNILLDHKTGEVVHIDLGVAFEMGRVLPVPELVPFRLTRDIVDGMGITGTEGVFRRCCEFTLHAMREETYSIMTILDVLRYDPLYSWSISPVRLAKLQGGGQDDADDDVAGKKQVNEPGEAHRALEVVRKKLSKTLSVTATVNDLINQATDISNLAVLYSGWAAYA